MATFHDYQCPLCEYRIDAMPSGYQMGEMSHWMGISCEECPALHSVPLPGGPREVMAALKREKGEEYVRALRGDGLMEEMARVTIAEAPLRCPVSDSHEVRPWTAPGPCPHCGETMEWGGAVMEVD